MKKVLSIILLLALTMTMFIGCGSKDEIPDLTGEWIVKNENGEQGMTMTITADSMEINWASDDTSALYWAGSFTPPTEAGDYTWTSTNDKDKTSGALLASGDDTKEFKYSGGKISLEVSAMGVTKTMTAEKVKYWQTQKNSRRATGGFWFM